MKYARLLALESVAATRRLFKAPRFALVSVLTIGAATAPSLLFALVGRAVLPKLPFERSEELVHIWQDGRFGMSYPMVTFLREHSRTLDVSGDTGATLDLEQNGESTRLQATAITPNHFSVLGVKPLLGRVFRDDENLRPFAHPVAILSEGLWKRRFGASPDIIGREIQMSGAKWNVVGVMPDMARVVHGHRFESAVWIPAMMSPLGMLSKKWHDTALAVETPSSIIWLGVARLRPGHTLEEARAESRVLGREVLARFPDRIPGKTPYSVVSMAEDAVNAKVARAVSLLKLAGVLVLLLGVINYGSLVLARGLARSASYAVHAVLGAPRTVLVWGTIFESMVLGFFGSAAAIGFSTGALSLLGRLEPTILTSPFGMDFDPAGWRANSSLVMPSLLLSLGCSVAAGATCAARLTGARRARLFRASGGVIAGGLNGLRLTRPVGLAIAFQLTAALALTQPALLMTRSLANLISADVGFHPRGLSTGAFELPISRYSEAVSAPLIEELVAAIRQEPGIENAAFASCTPVNCGRYFSGAIKRPHDTGPGFAAITAPISTGGIETLGVPLRAGRAFARSDAAEAPPVIILSEEAARQLGGAVVGSRVELQGKEMEIVGIIGDVSYGDLAAKPIPTVYLPLSQSPRLGGDILVRSALAPADLSGVLQRLLVERGVTVERTSFASAEERVASDLARFRGAAWLLGASALLSLLLAAIGTYGLMSTVIARSIPEIGLRLAVGASPLRIRAAISRASAILAAAGLVVGAALGSWGARLIEPYLFGVKFVDASGAFLLLIVAAILAAVSATLPARRASRVDPAIVLRSE